MTTGEWAKTLRSVFGEYRPATGIDGQKLGLEGDRVDRVRARIEGLIPKLGRRPRVVVGKPGLDGHSNGAEVIAVSARHVGFDVIYSGIRLSPDEIVRSAVEEDAESDRGEHLERLPPRAGRPDHGRLAGAQGARPREGRLRGHHPADGLREAVLGELFDVLIVETVGIGQSEADVRHLADRVYLVLQPLGATRSSS